MKGIAMQAVIERYLTSEEYLAMECNAEIKSEYLNGEVFAMSGASLTHTQIAANVVTALNTQFKGRPCRALGSDTRVKVSQTGLYTYPDVVVICGRLQLDDKQKDTLLNPTLLIEVLSPTTESYDRGAKFAHYRTLESLTDYVLILQTEARIEHFARQSPDKWLLSVYQGLEAVAFLPSIGCELPLSEVYDKVEWPSPETFTLRIVRERQAEYEDDTYARHPPPPQHHR
jgi:Uma2 family endonuclease